MQNLKTDMRQNDINKMPDVFVNKAFTDIFDIEGGTQPPKSNFIYEPKSGYVRLLQIRDFGENPVPTYIPKTKSLKTCNKDDVLIGRYGASVGRICTGMEGAYNVALTKVVPHHQTHNRYLYHLLSSHYFQEQLRKIERSAQNGFNKDDLADIYLPVIEDFNAQKTIAQKLDLLVVDVIDTKKRVGKAKQLIKKFRQAILSSAVTGKLTEDWREKNGNYDWKVTILGNVTKEKPRNGYSPRPVSYPTAIKSLTLSATTSGVFNPQYFKYIDKKIPKDSHLWLQSGDILIQRANSYELVGVSAIYNGKTNEFIYPDLMMKVKPNDSALGKFIYYVLSAPQTRTYFRQHSTGTSGNMPKINQGTVINTPLSLPSIDEQREIVRRVENYFNTLLVVEKQIEKAEARVSKLTQAVLAKTFRGKSA